ncbi:amidohydrolase family protein [uncultured Sphaerochaeta sp.]|uniref:amidohydrolase family protein n=1 Tax=uncultured Sphaerochaeta sp. TaxID=886478 RepID=UPI002AA94AA3|nr:amidohydrolase family protein [uncultured Sphaerochaeta sp.]
MHATTYEEIRTYIQELSVIDTHEHLPSHQSDRRQHPDILAEYISHYFRYDLFSSGLSQELYAKALDSNIPLLERWVILEPYWESCRFTGYGRQLDATAMELYGVAGITRENITELNAQYSKQISNKLYITELFKRMNIETCINDTENYQSDYDSPYAHPVCRIDHLVHPLGTQELRKIARISGIRIDSFAQYIDACQIIVKQAISRGAKALKLGLSYTRSLSFPHTDYHTAKEASRAYLDGTATAMEPAAQNYILHAILSIANQEGWNIQVHTGLQAGNGNYLCNSDPLLLTNLFLAYPQAKFHLLHIGYPYQGQLAVLVKSFPNVLVDMSWAHVVSPHSSIQFLEELLETVPSNKILAFGGDSKVIDLVAGHVRMAKDNISACLSRLIEAQRIDMDQAKMLSKKLLYDNPKQAFAL